MSDDNNTPTPERKCCFTARRLDFREFYANGCQFTAETKLFDVDGKIYCRFHMPLRDQGSTLTDKVRWSDADYKIFQDGIEAELERAINNGRRAALADNMRYPTDVADLTGVVFLRSFDFSAWAKSKNTASGESIVQHSPFPKFIAQGAHFASYTDFSRIKFLEASFADATFGQVVNFGNAIFLDVSFGNATVGGFTKFRSVNFKGKTSFVEATFKDEVDFTETKFHFSAAFHKATFQKAANFTRAEFHGAVKFVNAEIGDHTTFENAEFKDEVDFSADGDAPPFKKISFEGTKFLNTADFSNRKFSRAAKFDGAEFYKAPLFHDAVLHQGSTIADALFPDVSGDAARAYGTLKHVMQQLSAWDDMATFQALEQRSVRQKSKTPKNIKFVSWLYEKTSNYGQSFLRPFIGILGVAFAWFLFYCLVLGLAGIKGDACLLVEVFKFDLMQMVRPFEAFVHSVPNDPVLGPLGSFGRFAVITLAFLQTLATAGFVTLFILAVRRRFRMA